MKEKLILLLILALLSIQQGIAQRKILSEDEKVVNAAKQVLMRVIGMKAESFQFEKIPSENGLDVFEVIALSGKVQVKGSSTIAMTRGAYEYLRRACKVQYTWSTDKITVPSPLPDYVIAKTASPYKYRLYFNVCTFGYSTAFWKWEQWQQELDWMAMHGINMPLALLGQEAIWQKVFTDMGMVNSELSAFFTGPAFLPWQRMGNLYKHAGPLPQVYINTARDLQKQLLDRMKQLGMQPVIPGFSGFVPAGYKRINPTAQLKEVSGWAGFGDEFKSYMLSPSSPDFIEIGKRFMDEYKKTYGEYQFYLADLFNENHPPVSDAGKNEELAAYGKSVFDAINAANPKGTWVMQGWMFYNNHDFWTKDAVKSLLSNVPNDRMMIIDLATEEFKGYEQYDGFYGKPWIYSTIHNYGGNNQLAGNLPEYASGAFSMLRNPKKGNIQGFGISPEGIHTNEVVYELLTDVAWTAKPFDLKLWFRDYTNQRYGLNNDQAFQAWVEAFLPSYTSNLTHALNLYQVRPSADASGTVAQNAAPAQAIASFIKLSDQLGSNPLYRKDLIDLVIQFAGRKVDFLIRTSLDAFSQGDTAQCLSAFGKARELMLMMDGLIGSQPDQRLETWISMARKWGIDKEESDYFESNAKRQVTVWGTQATPALFDYAGKVWSGLIRDFYLQRWELYIQSLLTGKSANLSVFEENWISNPGLTTRIATIGDPLVYAKSLYQAAMEYAAAFSPVSVVKAHYAGGNKAEITLVPSDAKYKLYYETNGNKAGITSRYYSGPFLIELPARLSIAAYYNDSLVGKIQNQNLPVSFGKQIMFGTLPSAKHMAKGPASLTDGIRASSEPSDGNWVGYEGNHVSLTVDLEETAKAKQVTVGYLEKGDAMIYSPLNLSVETSVDGVSFSSCGIIDLNEDSWKSGSGKRSVTIKFPETEARYVRLFMFNRETTPQGQKAWIFLDEVTIE